MSDDVVIDDVVVAPEVVAAETEARKFGWVPKEEFKGSENDWRDAETFLQRGREINGYLRKDLEKLNRQLSVRDQEILAIKETMAEFKKYHEETQQRMYERAVKELNEQRKEAIKANDGDLVIELEEALEELKEQKPAPVKVADKKDDAPSAPPEEFHEWVEENQWYANDKQLQLAANGIADELRREYPSVVGKKFLDLVSKQVKEVFPEKFTKPKPIPSVEGNTGSARPNTKGKNYSDLPKEAKDACDRFVAQELITREEYVKQYFEE